MFVCLHHLLLVVLDCMDDLWLFLVPNDSHPFVANNLPFFWFIHTNDEIAFPFFIDVSNFKMLLAKVGRWIHWQLLFPWRFYQANVNLQQREAKLLEMREMGEEYHDALKQMGDLRNVSRYNPVLREWYIEQRGRFDDAIVKHRKLCD